MKFKTTLRLKSNIIDPVPFVNTMVLFIVFFVLAGQSIGRPGIVVDLLDAEQSLLYKADSTAISLTDKKIFLDDKEISIENLQEELIKMKPQLLAIRAGQDIPHSKVTEIIDIARRSGIEKIAIATEDGRR